MKRTQICRFGAIVSALAFAIAPGLAHADKTWHWRYSGNSINASGTLVTSDTQNADGFYQILSIAGSRNGDAIVGLYPAGQAIPGNAPYAIDNFIRIGSAGRITVKGFGYALASGAHANPYFADSNSHPGYNEVFTQGKAFVEQPIEFTAAPAP